MKIRLILLKILKTTSTWIILSLIFLFMLFTVFLYQRQSNFNIRTSPQIPEYSSIEDLDRIEREINEKIKEYPKERQKLTTIKNTIKLLRKNNIKYGDFYHRPGEGFTSDRYDFLSNSNIFVYLFIFLLGLYVVIKVFGEDFNQERSYMLIYHNKKRMPQLLKRIGMIFTINFLLVSFFSLLYYIFSLTYKVSHNYVIFESVGTVKLYKTSTFFFIHFYLVNIYNMFLITLPILIINMFSLKKVLTMVISFILGFTILFTTFIGRTRFTELTQPVFGDSILRLSYGTLIFIRIFIMIILFILFISGILYFRKRDLK